ncbi:alginate biosynthesis protein AlgX [Moritella sp. Urea-trap-13]|uniref:alginate O-acetyltransferase AlgX-related protein n=1 Tax=Moritella sp. Urea-trap-13 TaxID=2058327 RepID=UPI0018E2AB59|nr:alginate biosynthesis protein AlgX [Moritella sp. Urea-trap-13]
MRFVLLIMALILSSSSLSVSAAVPHSYQIEHVDSLCAAASVTGNYTSKWTRLNKYLVEGTNGWVYRSESDLVEDFRQAEEYHGLARLKAALNNQGTELVLMYIPTRGLINPDNIPDGSFNYDRAKQSYGETLAKIRKLGVIVPDFEAMIEKYRGDQTFYYKRDSHWSPTGAKITAEYVADTLRQSLSLDFSHKSDVVITKQGSYAIRSDIGLGVKHLCRDQYITEYVQGYGYEELNTDSALSSDHADTQVVLIGGSFTALPNLNFLGFLRNELKIPVDNYAMENGGLLGAWLRYFDSQALFKHPPKVIIWDISSYYPLDNDNTFAQLVPLAEGGCKKKHPLLHKSFTEYDPDSGSTALYFGEKAQGVRLRDLIFELDFPTAGVNRVKYRAWYSDGQVKSVELKKNERADTGGSFIFEFSNNLLSPSGSLIALEITEIGNASAIEYKRKVSQKGIELKICTRRG